MGARGGGCGACVVRVDSSGFGAHKQPSRRSCSGAGRGRVECNCQGISARQAPVLQRDRMTRCKVVIARLRPNTISPAMAARCCSTRSGRSSRCNHPRRLCAASWRGGSRSRSRRRSRSERSAPRSPTTAHISARAATAPALPRCGDAARKRCSSPSTLAAAVADRRRRAHRGPARVAAVHRVSRCTAGDRGRPCPRSAGRCRQQLGRLADRRARDARAGAAARRCRDVRSGGRAQAGACDLRARARDRRRCATTGDPRRRQRRGGHRGGTSGGRNADPDPQGRSARPRGIRTIACLRSCWTL